ncbi:PLP-dependent lyase/thiolase [uncultured Parvibaculum sp.]|uniref:PLP-dependent lyase/thiolase n=1 Tax=uncultured Parvibaculum sp. TaxID=291828 RepID=UPI0030DA4C25
MNNENSSPSENLSSSELHWSDENYRILRNGVQAVCLALDVTTSSFLKEMRKIQLQTNPTLTKSNLPDQKTIQRFLFNKESHPNTLFRKPEHLFLALEACRIIIDSTDIKNSAPDQDILNLIGMLKRYSSFKLKKTSITKIDNGKKFYSREELEKIRNAIVAPQTDDPDYPEFPPHSPRFPATPTYPIDVGDRKIYIKDESFNPTGSHKDRWAWEMLLQYKQIVAEAIAKGPPYGVQISSMISAGSAALAAQMLFRARGLPSLKVIMDQTRTSQSIVKLLESLGAEVKLHDLDARELTKDDVLEITDNIGGREITSRSSDAPYESTFYDWLVYEILNEVEPGTPTHIFLPVGSGDLFSNIAYILRKEKNGEVHDPRLQISMKDLDKIYVYGATTEEEKTNMVKLYAKYRPSLERIKDELVSFKYDKIIGDKSGIFYITDEDAKNARQYAQHNNIRHELSSLAGLALFIKIQNDIPLKDKVIVVNTGWMHVPPFTS